MSLPPPVQPPTRTQLLLSRVAAWNRSHPRQRIDPNAELRVAEQEGLSGGIGDGGHAFGPNQLNDAGGVLTGKLHGLSPQQKNAWAWSPEGIDYALGGVAGAAGGLTGSAAIDAIVRKFERPADPNGEVSRALGGSAGVGGGGAAPSPGGLAYAAAPDTRRQFAEALLGGISPTGQLGQSGLLQAITAKRGQPLESAWGTPGSYGLPGKPAASPTSPPAKPSKFASVDGIMVDASIAGQLRQVLARFGVTPTSGYRDPAHNAQVGGAGNSDHLRGDAVDFSGSPSALAALYKYAQGRYPYVEPMAQAKNHVHISFRR